MAKPQNEGLKRDNAKEPTTKDSREVNQEKVLKNMEEKLQRMGKSKPEIKKILNETKESMNSDKSNTQKADLVEKNDITTKNISEINQEKVIKSMEEKLRSRGKGQSEIKETLNKANSMMNDNRSNAKDQVKVKLRVKLRLVIDLKEVSSKGSCLFYGKYKITFLLRLC